MVAVILKMTPLLNPSAAKAALRHIYAGFLNNQVRFLNPSAAKAALRLIAS